jgi:hypothetical protein
MSSIGPGPSQLDCSLGSSPAPRWWSPAQASKAARSAASTEVWGRRRWPHLPAYKDAVDEPAVFSLQSLESTLAELTAKVNQLAEMQLAAASAPGPKRAVPSSAAA